MEDRRTDAVDAGAGSTIADVLARMTAIEAGLAPDDGVARFNDLYLAVTKEVAAQVGAETYEDAAFIARLDVVFAALYFRAFEASESGQPVSAAWAPLFEAHSRPNVAPIQFALAGMNAHINYDLCLALVTTCEALGQELEFDSPAHRDYLRVNALLERVEAEVKLRFATGLIGVADEALGRVDDVVAIWSVARARDAAWTHAQTLSCMPAVPRLKEAYLTALGGMVGLAGRGLLLPTL